MGGEDLSAYTVDSRQLKTEQEGKDSKKEVPTKIIKALRNFVEKLVPKKHFNRKITLTKMTNQVISQACLKAISEERKIKSDRKSRPGRRVFLNLKATKSYNIEP